MANPSSPAGQSSPSDSGNFTSGQSLPAQASTALHHLADSASQIAHDGVQAARDRALSMRDASCDYIRARPMQSVLMAAGTGAVLMLLVTVLARSGGHSR